MSAFHGPQHKGARRALREAKRLDAIARNSRTADGDRRHARCPDWCGHKTHARPSRHAVKDTTS